MKTVEQKNKIAQLNDPVFVESCLNAHLASYYPDFLSINKLELHPYKKHIGKTSAVFVVGYRIEYQSKNAENKRLNLVATGHSDGSRKAAFEKLNYLYNHGFSEGQYLVTRPLFYLEENLSFFYEASVGHRLFSFFQAGTEVDLKNALDLTAAWVKKLHQLEFDQSFPWPKFSVNNIGPSVQKFFTDFMNHNPALGKKTREMFTSIKQQEQELASEFKTCLVYGDYHPENIILISIDSKSLKMIDFTDVSLGDPMLDLGSFLQQFDFMGHRFFSRTKVNREKEYFVSSYFGKKLEDIPVEFFARINLYQAWTALRTASFLFYMHRDGSVRELLEEVEGYVNLISKKEKNINLH